MGTWGEVLAEFKASAEARGAQGPDGDGIRARYTKALHKQTGRATIVYASAWIAKAGVDNIDFSIGKADVHGLMSTCHGVKDRELDLVLHSPGGDPNAAEQMLKYLRTQFDHIRALVPLSAKSAATMLALGCDEIVMGEHSELGPIDPQVIITSPEGRKVAPAHAILRDFERAKTETAHDPQAALPAWTPILRTYAGGMLEFCKQQIELSVDIVAGWLEQYMLAHDDAGVAKGERHQRAREIAEWFGAESSYDRFRTHSRPIRLEDVRDIHGLRVSRLEDDNELQAALLGLYHAIDITFQGPAIKIIENHLGRRYIRVMQQSRQAVQVQLPGPGQLVPGPGIPPPPALPQNRQARRQNERKQQKGR